MNWNPPEVLKPRMGGGPKANVTASGTWLNSRAMVAMMAANWVSLDSRSSHGFSRQISVDTFEALVRVAMSRPPSARCPAIPGRPLAMLSIFRVAASVRSRDAPSGSRMET